MRAKIINKKSLKFKLSMIALCMIVAISLAMIILSNAFLKQYYMHSKKVSLIDTFNEINEIYLDELVVDGDMSNYSSEDTPSNNNIYDSRISDDLNLRMEQISSNQNVSVVIFRDINSSFSFVFDTSTKLLLYSSLGTTKESKVETSYIYSDYVNSVMNGDIPKNVTIAPNYLIKEVEVKRLATRYIYLAGEFGNGDHILIRASVEGMNESISWANHFYMLITVSVGLIAFILMYIVCSRFLAPITELNKIAEKMSELNFDTKYEVRTEDEVGSLGRSINVLSTNLERTLCELKEANSKLTEDLQEKERIDEMRKEFLSNVSHELKTPIALIQGYAEGLQDNITDDEESREYYCEVIVDEAKRMNNMVKKIIALNQLEFGYGNVSIEHFEISDVLRAVISRSDILIKQKEAKINFLIEPQLVWSDAFIVEEVFTNYLTNALNHLNYDMMITISSELHDDHIRINVHNTGDPIPEEDIDLIWDKFYKVDKARTREYGGSGVGLSIVKASMELLKQSYGVKNENNGVTFWFELDCK